MSKKKYKISWIKVILRFLLLPIVILWLIIRKFKQKNSRKTDAIDIYNLSQIDSLSGGDFENLLKTIFEKQGYDVELTKKSHDYGADLVLKKNNKLSVVQAKCYDKTVGIKAVQEIISAQKHYHAEDMFVATNRYFSKDAIVLASEHDVKLIDRDVIGLFVRKYLPQIELSQKKYVATNIAEKEEIKKRFKFWI